MEYRKLGSTDIRASILALGCWGFAGGKFWGEQDEQDSVRTIEKARELGVNFFDTAESYGSGYSEEILGKALAGRREKAVIATKAVNDSLGDVISACENSLKRLRTDYIDLYYIHWVNAKYPLEKTVEDLEKLKQQGKIRAIGVCNFGAGSLGKMDELGKLSLIDAHQLPYSLFWRAIEYKILGMSLEKGLSIVCYSPLAQGLLTGLFKAADDVPAHLKITRYYRDGNNTTHGEDGCEEEVFSVLPKIADIARELGVTMPELAIAWLFAKTGVSNVLTGARKPEELAENVKALEVKLPEDVVAELDRITLPVKEKLSSNPDMWCGGAKSRFI